MSFKCPDVTDIKALSAILKNDPARVLTGQGIQEEYSHDEMYGVFSAPDIVLRVQSAGEVSSIMAYAFKKGIPVTPRGSGSGLVGAAVPIQRGILLDMSLMDRILELDEKNLTLAVEPGVLLMEVAAFAETHGLFYPPDPGEKTATIGGNISTNAGGMRAVKYGVTRDYVQALEVVLPNGTLLELGGKVVKNSSGYDLKDLIIGAEGTLAVITKATLKLLALPRRTVSLLVPFPSIAMAIGTVPLIIQSQALPAAIEFLEREVMMDAEQYLGMRFPDTSSTAYLMLRFDGSSMEEMEQDYAQVAELCLAQGAPDVLISDTPERDEALWKPRGAFLEAIKNSTTYMDEMDMVVPRSHVAEMVEFIHTTAVEVDIRIKCFGHAGDGNLHAYVLQDDLPGPVWTRKMTAAMDKIYAKAHELSGQVSGEHGIGWAKREYLKQSLAPASISLMRGIKAVFDPRGILNPDTVI